MIGVFVSECMRFGRKLFVCCDFFRNGWLGVGVVLMVGKGRWFIGFFGGVVRLLLRWCFCWIMCEYL